MMMMKSSNMRRRMELQGPRPSPLAVTKNSKKMMMKKKKLPNSSVNNQSSDGPVIVYLISPKIIHVQPEEFMGLVQRLTGNNNPQGSSTSTTVNASHHYSSSCLSKLGGDFSETQIQHRTDLYADHDQVPFGIPTASPPTSNFAEICNLASYFMH